MDERAFVDRGTLPKEEAIKEALGKAYAYYSDIDGRSEDCTKEWKYQNRRYGWLLKVSRRKKPIYSVILLKKHFLVGCHLKPAERAAILERKLLEKNRRILEGAHEFPEGYAIELEVLDEASYADVSAILGLLLAERP